MNFFKSLIKELIDRGNIIDIATNESHSQVPDYFKKIGCNVIHVSTSRSPFSFGNIKAIKQIRNIAKDYDIVHCHTPLAGMATRLACKRLRRNQGLKVIYTAHGFHFYKGASIKNWLLYYPIEKMCSKWTDLLITINKEDFEFAKKKMKAKQIEYVPGVGIDVNKYSNTIVNKEEKKREIGVPNNSIVILSVGELNNNKNHQIVIKAIAKLNLHNIHYLIAGQGSNKERLETLAKKKNVNLHLLGFRNDVYELYKIADIYILPSIREGLNVSVMEALASGCTVLASKIRGNVDMIPPENCFSPFNENELANLISKKTYIYDQSFIKKIDYKAINKTMLSIYGVE